MYKILKHLDACPPDLAVLAQNSTCALSAVSPDLDYLIYSLLFQISFCS